MPDNEQSIPVKQPAQVKPNSTQAATETRIKEITNVNRIVSNAIALILGVEIKGADAQPVTEILGWLTGFSQSLAGQTKALQSTLPKPESATPVAKYMSKAKSPGAVAKSEPVKAEVK